MNQRLSDWASITEIASGLAVVVTLVLLLLGIRDNTEITRVSVYADLINNINEWERDIYRDPDLSRIWTAYMQRETARLEPGDRERLSSVVMVLFRNYDKAYFSQRYSVIGSAEWNRFLRLICINYRRARSADLDFGGVVSDEFVEFVLASCSE
jgi:hypothetical protein